MHCILKPLPKLYSKVDFSIVLNRIIDISEQILPPAINKSKKASSRRHLLPHQSKTTNHKLSPKSKTVLKVITQAHNNRPELDGNNTFDNDVFTIPTPQYITLIKNDNRKKSKLVEIIKLLIRRGAVISKYILALVVLANDAKLLEIVEEYGCWEEDHVYSDYKIGEYRFNIFHIASLGDLAGVYMYLVYVLFYIFLINELICVIVNSL